MKALMILIFCFPFTAFAEGAAAPELADLLKEAHMVPHREAGKVTGYKIVKLKKGGRFEKLGFKQGDVVTDDSIGAMELYNQLDDSEPVDVQGETVEE